MLDFYAIESPLAQPRNAVLGQAISAVIGTAVCKLLALSPHFEAVRWLGASLACALATAAMGLTGTVHPPAGATALMAVLNDDVSSLGWFLLAPVLLGCTLMLSVALLVNNIQRRFPYYWWSPEETGSFWRRDGKTHETEKGAALSRTPTKTAGDGTDVDIEASGAGTSDDDASNASGTLGGGTVGTSSHDLERHPTTAEFVEHDDADGEDRLIVTKFHVRIPKRMYLTDEEKLMLEIISQRL